MKLFWLSILSLHGWTYFSTIIFATCHIVQKIECKNLKNCPYSPHFTVLKALCDINVIRCSAMVGGGGEKGHGGGTPPPPPRWFFFFFFFPLFFSFVLLFFLFFTFIYFYYFFFLLFFFFFACQLRAQSCTLMMIIPLPHYDNLATNYFQVGESVNEPHNDIILQLHVFNLWSLPFVLSD